MGMSCNGSGDCDSCRNRHCREWVECDVCGEAIDDIYYEIGDGVYCADCMENHKHIV